VQLWAAAARLARRMWSDVIGAAARGLADGNLATIFNEMRSCVATEEGATWGFEAVCGAGDGS